MDEEDGGGRWDKKRSCRPCISHSMHAADDMYDISGGSGAIRMDWTSALATISPAADG